MLSFFIFLPIQIRYFKIKLELSRVKALLAKQKITSQVFGIFRYIKDFQSPQR
jgi:hypothetical protein